MAKGFDKTMIERHLEKAILGLAVIVFIYAVFTWGIASPNVSDLFTGEKQIPPDQFDAHLAKISSDMRENMKKLPIQTPPLHDYAANLGKLQGGPSMEYGVAMDLGSGRLPLAGTERGKPSIKLVGVARLAALTPRPEIPCIMAGRELPYPDGAGKASAKDERPVDQMVAHGVTVYPWGELVQKWNAELAEAGITFRPVVLGMIAEYQEMRGDGTWPADKDARPVRLSLPPDLKVPAVPPFTGKNSDEIEAVKTDLLAKWQGRILQPDYPRVWLPESGWVLWWTNSHADGAKDVAALLEAQAGAAPAAPADKADSGAASAPAKPASTARGSSRKPVSGASVRLKTQEVEPSLALPSLDAQKREGKIFLWFHDKPLDTTCTYRYRVRLVLLNPLLGLHAKMLQSASDNAVVSITTLPSEWSRPVRVFKDMDFFVTGGNKGSDNAGEKKIPESINVSVFAYCMGQRVRHNFTKVEGGRSIGENRVRAQVVNPVSGTPVSVETDFKTGAVAVAFDFAKRYFNDRLNKEAVTTQVLYLDENGNLRTKILAVDEESPHNARLKEEAQATEDAVKAAK